jgi:hypothetical protein
VLRTRYTEAFEFWTIRLLQATKSQTKTAQLLRCKFDVVGRILHRSVERGERSRAPPRVKLLSVVDEKVTVADFIFSCRWTAALFCFFLSSLVVSDVPR